MSSLGKKSRAVISRKEIKGLYINKQEKGRCHTSEQLEEEYFLSIAISECSHCASQFEWNAYWKECVWQYCWCPIDIDGQTKITKMVVLTYKLWL